MLDIREGDGREIIDPDILFDILFVVWHFTWQSYFDVQYIFWHSIWDIYILHFTWLLTFYFFFVALRQFDFLISILFGIYFDFLSDVYFDIRSDTEHFIWRTVDFCILFGMLFEILISHVCLCCMHIFAGKQLITCFFFVKNGGNIFKSSKLSNGSGTVGDHPFIAMRGHLWGPLGRDAHRTSHP
jgi:hypothetical protein